MQDKRKVKFKKNTRAKLTSAKTILITGIVALLQSILLGYISLKYVEGLSLLWATLIVVGIVFIGVFFDILGIAVTAAEETPFNSMAASKVSGAKESISIIRHASVVANFCNDVIGDICGIISGSVAAVIVVKINKQISLESTLISVLVTSLIATMTILGKAIGKGFAIRNANYIVFKMAAVYRILTLKIIFDKKEDKQ